MKKLSFFVCFYHWKESSFSWFSFATILSLAVIYLCPIVMSFSGFAVVIFCQQFLSRNPAELLCLLQNVRNCFGWLNFPQHEQLHQLLVTWITTSSLRWHFFAQLPFLEVCWHLYLPFSLLYHRLLSGTGYLVWAIWSFFVELEWLILGLSVIFFLMFYP